LTSTLRFFVLLITSAALAACQTTPGNPPAAHAETAIEIRKSPNDDREYRYLELDNRLQVLLVSDPATDKAAASLVVFRGSYHEPDEFPGLAHFLEHMLFIGTEKYPDVDAYAQFVSQHGGSYNAYTAGDHTNYFFDIQPAFFAEGIDRFAQFFIAPLLAEDYVEREKNAVHSEYQMQIRADNWRANAVLATAINPQHPRARFNIGSLETLGDGVQAALEAWYEAAYSADQMALVVLAPESLDALEALVRPIFTPIPDRGIGPAGPTPPLFAEGQLPALLSFQPIKDTYRVSYSFPVPSVELHYQVQPASYIANLLGHEGAGSLHQALLDRGWIESLAAGTWTVDETTSLITVDIDLTPTGHERVAEVTDMVFRHIELLQSSPPEAWRYAEQAQVAELGFRFQERSSATGFVYQVAPRLMRYPPQDVLIAPYLMTEFDRELITDYLARLTPDNVLVRHSGPDVETDQRERWFDVPYRLQRGPAPRTPAADAALALPAPNPFLPARLDVLADDPAPPVPALTRPGLALWVDRDTEFGTPRANLYLSLGIPGGIASAEELAFAQLYHALVEDRLSAAVYPAYLAGLGFSLAVSGYGLEVRVNGYSDKQFELLRVILAELTRHEIDPDRFTVIRDRLRRDWQNYREERPFNQAMGALGYLLQSDRWPPESLSAALQDRTPADLERWRNERLERFSVAGLLHGNVDPGDANRLAAAIEDHLALADFPRVAPQVRAVTSLTRYPIEVEHEDAALVLYVQDRIASLPARAQSALAASILRQAFFTSLRTEQQLGYVVSLSNQVLRDQGGLAFIIQSPVASAAELKAASRDFLVEQIDVVAQLPADDYARFQQGLIARVTERDRNLGERGRRLWSDLDLGFTDFDTREQIAAAIAAIRQQDIVDYLRAVLADFDTRSLVIYAPGRFADAPQAGSIVGDVSAWKRSP